jgi:hypothetical protein
VSGLRVQLPGSCLSARTCTLGLIRQPPDDRVVGAGSICRKTAGSTGAAVNLGADNTTMKVIHRVRVLKPVTRPHQYVYCRFCIRLRGSCTEEQLHMCHLMKQVEGETAVYHAVLDRKSGETSPAERHFCLKYGLAACAVMPHHVEGWCRTSASAAMVRLQVRQRAVAVRQPLARSHPPAGKLTGSWKRYWPIPGLDTVAMQSLYTLLTIPPWWCRRARSTRRCPSPAAWYVLQSMPTSVHPLSCEQQHRTVVAVNTILATAEWPVHVQVCLMLSARPDWAVVPPDPPAEHYQVGQCADADSGRTPDSCSAPHVYAT